MKTMRSVALAFTLTELLVVLAVIGVLSTMLFPVVAKELSQSAAQQCLSNERTLSGAILEYAADNDSTFPLWERDANTGEIANGVAITGQPVVPWHWLISEYVACKYQSVSYYAGNFNYDGGAWSCPSFGILQPDNYGLSSIIAGDASINSLSQGYDWGRYGSITTAGIPSPSKSIMVAEKGYMGGGVDSYTTPGFMSEEFIYVPDATDVQAANALNGNATESDAYPWPPDVPAFRHSNEANVVYADGHVGSITVNAVSGMKNWCENVWVPNPNVPSWYPYPAPNGQTCSMFVK